MSKRRRAGIIVLCVLMAVTLIRLDHTLLRRRRQQRPRSEEQAKVCDFEKYHAKSFTAVNVIDGDTIDINIPDGQYNRTRIRLWGIDTPETESKKSAAMYFGPAAAEFTEKSVLGKTVTVYLDEGNRTRGKYGRLLAYVHADGRFLNEVLLAEGFAYADTKFRHSFYHKYKQIEAAARSRKKGLWEKVTPEQMPQWRQRKTNGD